MITASSLVLLCKLRKTVKSKPTCMCNVGQVVVPGAAGKLLQFSVGQVKSPARGSLLERLLHAPAGRYCGRQLGSIPSSHQTYRSASSFTLFEASAPLSYPADSHKLQNERPSRELLSKYKIKSEEKSVGEVSCDCVSHTTGAIVSTTNRERHKLSIFQEVASSWKISQQYREETVSSLQNKSANLAT